MINLAGVKEADEHIQEELYSAGIEIVRGELSKGEVPYSITGKLADWFWPSGLFQDPLAAPTFALTRRTFSFWIRRPEPISFFIDVGLKIIFL